MAWQGGKGGFQAQKHVCKGSMLEYGREVRQTDHRGWTECASGSDVGRLAQQPRLCRPPSGPLCQHTTGLSAERGKSELSEDVGWETG